MRMLMIAAAVALAACGADPKLGTRDAPPDDPPRCKGQGTGTNDADCTIVVDVVPKDGGCMITVGAGLEIVEFEKNAKNKWIVWRLRDGEKDFSFTGRGIEFKNDDPSDPNFIVGNAYQQRKAFHWKNRNKAGGGEYEYGIEVRNLKTNVACGFDPVIKNQA